MRNLIEYFVDEHPMAALSLPIILLFFMVSAGLLVVFTPVDTLNNWLAPLNLTRADLVLPFYLANGALVLIGFFVVWTYGGDHHAREYIVRGLVAGGVGLIWWLLFVENGWTESRLTWAASIVVLFAIVHFIDEWVAACFVAARER